MGSAAFPYGLAMQRSYTSGQRLKSGPLGLGWTHSFAVSVQPGSDGPGTVNIEIKKDAKPRTSVFTATTTSDGGSGNSLREPAIRELQFPV